MVISSLLIEQFKCFSSLEIRPKGLTVLTGLNSSGKSSVIHALLVLLQSEGNRHLVLNGDWVKLGTAQDVLFDGAQSQTVGLGVNGAKRTFAYTTPHAQHLAPTDDTPEHLPLPSSWQYLSCERLGPRVHSEISSQMRARRQIGPLGEYASDFVARLGTEAIRSPLLQHRESVATSLEANLEAWLSEVAPGVRPVFTPHDRLDVVQTQFGFSAPGVVPTLRRPTNSGFALSYALPVFVSGLSMRRDSLLVVENPESHLHPRGQFRIGTFLSLVAASGTQVVMETHSDHVLNAVRIAVKDQILSPTDVTVLYFERSARDGRFVHAATQIEIDKHGRMSLWPAGFFDEFDMALDRLI